MAFTQLLFGAETQRDRLPFLPFCFGYRKYLYLGKKIEEMSNKKNIMNKDTTTKYWYSKLEKETEKATQSAGRFLLRTSNNPTTPNHSKQQIKHSYHGPNNDCILNARMLIHRNSILSSFFLAPP